MEGLPLQWKLSGPIGKVKNPIKLKWVKAGQRSAAAGMREVRIQTTVLFEQCMRFSTMWYVRLAKAQTSQRIRAV